MAGPQIRFIDSLCVQKAVYWHPPDNDGYGGYTFATVEEIKVRWDDKAQLIRTVDGIEFVNRAEILIHSEVGELKKQGYMMLTALTDLTNDDQANPKALENAFQVARVTKTPLFRSTDEFVRRVYL